MDNNDSKMLCKSEFTWFPRVLVIGPGGFKGLKALGFLSPIEDSGLLQYVDTYCGVSVGAIISLLIVAGYKIREIVGEAATLDIFKDMENFTIQSILDNRGLISNEPVRKKLSQLILNKFGTIPTLHNLYMQTGKAYVSVTLNATDDECEIMDPFTHPHISCVDATMFSMNIPFVFYQIIYQGKTYVDGALGNPYPIDYFDNGETNILGIYMKTIHPKNNIHVTTSKSRDPSIIKPIIVEQSPRPILKKIDEPTHSSLPIGTYSFKIISALMDQRRNQIIQHASSKCKHVGLETSYVNMVGYNITTEEKAHMLVEGFNEGKAFISQLYTNTYVGPKIPPRHTYFYPPYYMVGEDDQPVDDGTTINMLSAMNSHQ